MVNIISPNLKKKCFGNATFSFAEAILASAKKSHAMCELLLAARYAIDQDRRLPAKHANGRIRKTVSHEVLLDSRKLSEWECGASSHRFSDRVWLDSKATRGPFDCAHRNLQCESAAKSKPKRFPIRVPSHHSQVQNFGCGGDVLRTEKSASPFLRTLLF